MKNLFCLRFSLPCLSIAFAADVQAHGNPEFDSQIGGRVYTYMLKQEGDKLTGKASSEINDQKRETPLTEGKVEGDKVSFVEMLNFNGNDIRIDYSGTVSTNEMKLIREVGTFAKEDIILKRDALPNDPLLPASVKDAVDAVSVGPSPSALMTNPPFQRATRWFRQIARRNSARKIETVEYDSKSVGTKRKALIYTPRLFR
jgi:hypothetical protein